MNLRLKKVAYGFKLIGIYFLLFIYFILNALKILCLVCKSLFSYIILFSATAIAAYVAYVIGLQFSWCKNFTYAFRSKKQIKDSDFLFDKTHLGVHNFLNIIRFK